MTVRRTLRVSLAFLLSILAWPGERHRRYTVEPALPEDARLVCLARPTVGATTADDVIELVIESAAWTADEAAEPLSPTITVAWANDDAVRG